MKALTAISATARRPAAAGCDIALVCSGDLADTKAAAAAAPPLGGAALARYKRACAILLQRPQAFDVADAETSPSPRRCASRPESV